MNPNSTAPGNVSSLFGSAQAEGAITAATASLIDVPDMGLAIQAAMGIAVDDIKASETVLVLLLIDDSGSIRFAGNSDTVRAGVNGLLDALGSSKQGSSILVHIRYLNGTVLCPFVPLDQAPRLTTSNYNPNGGTPLNDQMAVICGTVIAKAQELSDAGIACRSVTCVVTDGNDEGSTRYRRSEDVKPIVHDLLASERHIVAAMGIDDKHTDFNDVFGRMGVQGNWILTPANDPHEIRKAFVLMSKSAVRASQAAGSFSQTAAGGFGV